MVKFADNIVINIEYITKVHKNVGGYTIYIQGELGGITLHSIHKDGKAWLDGVFTDD